MARSSSTKWGVNFTSITRRGAGQVDDVLPDHLAGAGAHQKDPVGQRDGLGEVVGDVEDGTAGGLPGGEDLILKALAGEGVQGAKGSSIIRMAGSMASTRAMAARFFMPPESSRGSCAQSRPGPSWP